MKKNYFLIAGILLLLLVGGYFQVHKFSGNGDELVAEDAELNQNNLNRLSNSNNKENTDITDEIKDFFHPKAKNELVAFTNKNGNDLYIYRRGEKPKLLYKKVGMKGNYYWSKNGEEIYFKEKDDNYNSIVKKIDIKTLEITEYLNLPPLTSLQNFNPNGKFYYLDNKTLNIKSNNIGQNANITNDGMYYNIIQSPNDKYFIAHKGANAYLFSSDGELLRKIGKVLITDWHDNNENFIGFLDSSNDGHSINNSDLYIGNIKYIELKKLTNTQNKAEINPTFFESSIILFDDLLNNEMSFINFNINDFK